MKENLIDNELIEVKPLYTPNSFLYYFEYTYIDYRKILGGKEVIHKSVDSNQILRIKISFP